MDDANSSPLEATIFRCANCGKWSHAKRQPKTHQRWVYAGDPEYRDELNENVGYDGDYGGAPSAHPIACGPFEPYLARRATA